MINLDDQPQLVSVVPPLRDPALAVVRALAGVGRGPRRIWAGQPSARSPWLPCRRGCCLVLEATPREAADWLRFLVREVLSPQAAASVARARVAGFSPGAPEHRLDGEVVLDDGVTSRLLLATGRRVRVVPLDDELLPVAASRPSHAGEVVRLDRLRDN